MQTLAVTLLIAVVRVKGRRGVQRADVLSGDEFDGGSPACPDYCDGQCWQTFCYQGCSSCRPQPPAPQLACPDYCEGQCWLTFCYQGCSSCRPQPAPTLAPTLAPQPPLPSPEPAPTPAPAPQQTFKLVDSVSSQLGRVMVFYENDWHDIAFNRNFLFLNGVACHQLGFDQGEIVFSWPGETVSGTVVSGVDCPHREAQVSDCNVTLDELENATPTGLLCVGNESGLPDLAPNEVAVIGAGSSRAGVMWMGADDGVKVVDAARFSTLSASVACRQIGFHGAASFGGSKVFPWPTNAVNVVECNGTEMRLQDCDVRSSDQRQAQTVILICEEQV